MTGEGEKRGLPERLRAALLVARKERDEAAVSGLRVAIAAIENAGAIEVEAGSVAPAGNAHFAGTGGPAGSTESERRVLGPDKEAALLRAEVDGLRDAAEAFGSAGRDAEAERARAEAAAIERFLG